MNTEPNPLSLKLGRACLKGDLAGIADALDAGADIDERIGFHEPLVLALKEGRAEAAKLLLQRGASPNGTPFDRDMIKPLTQAARRGDMLEMVAALLDAGANPNADSGAALDAAVSGNDFPLAQLLLERGAKPEFSEPDANRTPTPPALRALRNAYQLKNPRMIRLLLKYMMANLPPESPNR